MSMSMCMLCACMHHTLTYVRGRCASNRAQYDDGGPRRRAPSAGHGCEHTRMRARADKTRPCACACCAHACITRWICVVATRTGGARATEHNATTAVRGYSRWSVRSKTYRRHEGTTGRVYTHITERII